ncbi:MAG: hypothetical protein GXP59_00990 [Deltaproteobacteria bacterium]|nr:hypothetical protein [Deltaproteobacteria bacterium]
MILRTLSFVILLAVYGAVFSQQEILFRESSQQLAYPSPPEIQKAALGYLKQLGGEMQFIKAGVFYGGVKAGRDPLEYIGPFAQHLAAAAILNPEFTDTYYLCQATLPQINNKYATFANKIYALGMQALPNNFVLPFFTGFNYFYYLKDRRHAAELLKTAAEKPDGPLWVGHLAAILEAEDGDIYGGLVWLKVMLAGEKNKAAKKRYRHSIAMFTRAVTIQKSINIYKKRYGTYPPTLSDLIPDILPTLPKFDPPFQIKWIAPKLSLVRAKR